MQRRGADAIGANRDISWTKTFVNAYSMIGGGFGGCTLTLVETPHADELLTRLPTDYVQLKGTEPATYICEFGSAGGMVT